MGPGTEKFPLPFDLRLLFTFGQWLGYHDHWSTGSAIERWHCRCDLVLFCRHYWLHLLYALHGRNGEHGTYRVSPYLNTSSHDQEIDTSTPSGGQYHWVSEFAPRQYQQFLSYMTGWLSVCG